MITLNRFSERSICQDPPSVCLYICHKSYQFPESGPSDDDVDIDGDADDGDNDGDANDGNVDGDADDVTIGAALHPRVVIACQDARSSPCR